MSPAALTLLQGVIVAIITAGAVVLAQRLTARATIRGVEAEHDVNAGQLALDTAREVRGEVTELKAWRTKVMVWVRGHERYDDAVERKLTQAGVDLVDVPAREPFPY